MQGGGAHRAVVAYADAAAAANGAQRHPAGPAHGAQAAGGDRCPAFQMLPGPITMTRRPASESANAEQGLLEQGQGRELRSGEPPAETPALSGASGRPAQHGVLPVPDAAAQNHTAEQPVCSCAIAWR